uniref:Parallel beta-helix repeat n=1 Tax=uncultured bacterium AOCefta2 TaxID=654977 RepID=D6MLW8_9BACT|nr:parallel beta-helix repeat precursor [uncultured bacterium AOCefta2]
MAIYVRVDVAGYPYHISHRGDPGAKKSSLQMKGKLGRMTRLICLFGMLTGISIYQLAAQPMRFNYQARLTNGSGIPLQGNHAAYFSLFSGGNPTVADDGTLLFKESANLSILNGAMNHEIGTGTNLFGGSLTTLMLRTDDNIYVQVAVDADMPSNVVLPRSRFSSVPYALLSADGERRHQISGPAPIEITQPGSYVLTGNLVVEGEDAITISASHVTLDLNGFTISSTSELNMGSGIMIVSGASDIKIQNGHIAGGVGLDPNNGLYTGPGFYSGIDYSDGNTTAVQVANVSVSGCSGYGLSLPLDKGSFADSCVVQNIDGTGISVNSAKRCEADRCKDVGILAQFASDCSGRSPGPGVGIQSSEEVLNCMGYSISGAGIVAAHVLNSTGNSTSGTGVTGDMVTGCKGLSSNGAGIDGVKVSGSHGFSLTGVGISATVGVSDSLGQCTKGSADGIYCGGTVSNSSGYSESGRGLYAERTAQNCYGQSLGAGVGLETSVAMNCYGKSDTGIGLTFTKVGPNCFGEKTGGSDYVLGSGQAGPKNLP